MGKSHTTASECNCASIFCACSQFPPVLCEQEDRSTRMGE